MRNFARRVPASLLLLLAAPIGCSQEDAARDAAATPTAPGPVAPIESAPPKLVVEPTDAQPTVDAAARRASGVVEAGAETFQQAEGEVRSDAAKVQAGFAGALDEARSEAKNAADRAKGEIKDAADQAKGGARKALKDAEAAALDRARSAKDGIKKSAEELEKGVLDGLLGPSKP